MKVFVNESTGFLTVQSASPEQHRALTVATEKLMIGDDIFWSAMPILEPSLLNWSLIHPDFFKPLKPAKRFSLRLDGKDFEFTVEKKEENLLLQNVRMTCGYLKIRPTFVNFRKLDDAVSLDLVVGYCKKCFQPAVNVTDLSFLCHRCAEKCPHTYRQFVTTELRDSKTFWIFRAYCTMCGRPSPLFDPAEYAEEEHFRKISLLLGGNQELFKVVCAEEDLRESEEKA
jgi:hypothetical protein